MSSARWDVPGRGGTGGHRLFRLDSDGMYGRRAGDLAVADNSGLWPHTTDDGVLFIDTTRPMVVGLVAGRFRAFVPVVEAGTEETYQVVMVPAAGNRVAEIAGLRVELDEHAAAQLRDLEQARALADLPALV